MSKYIAACTTMAPSYPGYVNFSRENDGSVTIITRGDPTDRGDESKTVSVRLTADEWKELVAEIGEGVLP
jgi:hypothetical protein